jgi:demethylmenaquinone methyltransferase/2-methoxy-6-polyprenyl-1,4-benzoquinol methylase
MSGHGTDFGYEDVPPAEKTRRVTAVFESVATRYDLMNDLMSLGVHRLWKRRALQRLNVRPGQRVLDLAGGTGDLTRRLSRMAGSGGHVILADINEAMLEVGRDRLLDAGVFANVGYVRANAEALPFAARSQDRVIIGFGLRNVTDKAAALREMHRVLRPGGALIILEFSHLVMPLLQRLYDLYSFNVIPRLGHWIARDAASYQYLVESIRRHPDQAALAAMMTQAGFELVDVLNLSGGVVALHRGYRL